MSHLDDLPHCIRVNLGRNQVAMASLPSTARSAEGTTMVSGPSSSSRVERDGRRDRSRSCRARLRPNKASATQASRDALLGPPKGPPPPRTVDDPLFPAAADLAALSSPCSEALSLDSSELEYREDLHRRGQEPDWLATDSGTRRAALARDRAAEPLPADTGDMEGEESESEEAEDDPPVTDLHRREHRDREADDRSPTPTSLRSPAGPAETEHRTDVLLDDNFEDFLSASSPEDLGFEAQTRD